MRVGVFICHCGNNIAGTVDVGRVAEEIRKIPGVVYATDYMYTCSEPGQDEIKEAIKREGLNRVVVAACSPRMHEVTFRRTVEKAGLNRYFFEMANIREHVSWVGENKEANTGKAIEAIRMAVMKVMEDKPLYSSCFFLPWHVKKTSRMWYISVKHKWILKIAAWSSEGRKVWQAGVRNGTGPSGSERT